LHLAACPSHSPGTSVHICLTYMHHDKAQKFIADLTESVHDVRTNPKNYRDGSAAIYGLAASIPDKSIVDELARAFIDTLFKTQA
jgi:sphinganine-1-phosphate aldolase